MNVYEIEQKQLKEILDGIANYVPILKCILINNNDINPTRIKKYILAEKKERGNSNLIKCFYCGETKGKFYLKQISTLSRCSDELIETHHLCEKCRRLTN